MRSAAALVLLFSIVAASYAQEFSGLDDAGTQLNALQAQARAQKKLPQAPPVRAMGVAGRSAIKGAAAETHPDVSSYRVRGIDVSHHQNDQGEIDWGAVKAAGISFAYIKATEGADTVDGSFTKNWEGAARAGLTRGAYHFFNFCRRGSAQADNLIARVPADPDALPVTVDLENSDDCASKDMPSTTTFHQDLGDFVAKIEARFGRPPIVYMNDWVYDHYYKYEKSSYKLWVVDTQTRRSTPSSHGGASWTLWQCGWHERVAGVPGEVDLDVFNGTPEDFAALSAPPGELVALP